MEQAAVEGLLEQRCVLILVTFDENASLLVVSPAIERLRVVYRRISQFSETLNN